MPSKYSILGTSSRGGKIYAKDTETGQYGLLDEDTGEFFPESNIETEAAKAVAEPVGEPTGLGKFFQGTKAAVGRAVLGGGLGGVDPLSAMSPVKIPNARAEEVGGKTGRMGLAIATGAATGGGSVVPPLINAGGEMLSQHLNPSSGSEGMTTMAATDVAARAGDILLGRWRPAFTAAKAFWTGMVVRGGGTLAGTLVGEKADEEVRRFLGKPQSLGHDGVMWLLPVAASGVLGGTFEAVNRKLTQLGTIPSIKAINDLEYNPYTQGKDFGVHGSAERLGLRGVREFAGAEEQLQKASKGTGDVLDQMFPPRTTDVGALQIHENIHNFVNRRIGGYRGELTKLLDKDEINLLDNFISKDFTQARKMISELYEKDDMLTLVSILRKSLKVSGDPSDEEMLDTLVGDWIRRELMGKAVLEGSLGKVPEGKGFSVPWLADEETDVILDGKRLLSRVLKIGPNKIDRALGKGRAEAFSKIFLAMDAINPASEAGKAGNLAGAAAKYNAFKMFFMFAGPSAAATGAGAMAAGQTLMASVPLMGAAVAGIYGLAHVIKAVANRPELADLFTQMANHPEVPGYTQRFLAALNDETSDPIAPKSETLLPPNASETR